MKKIYIIISAIAVLALTSACNLKTEFPPLAGENQISLNLQFSEPGVKSDGVGKENTINSVDYFFYTDTTEAAVFSKRDDSPTVSGGVYTISVEAGKDGVPSRSELFVDGKFELFAVFNAPEAITNADLTTIKQIAVDQSFAYYKDANPNKGWNVTPDRDPENHDKFFVMTGQKAIRKASGGSYANLDTDNTVDMKRLAAKVSAKINILSSKTLDEDNTTWNPMLGAENVRLYLCNFVQNSLLGAVNAQPFLPENYTQDDYRVYALNTNDLEPSDGYYVIESQQDFYTYPIEWEAGAANEPYFKLIIPWKEAEGTVPNKELYYKIMFPPSITSIEANKFYQLEVTVDFMGNEGEPTVTIEGHNAQVVDWKANSAVSSAVSDAKYLSVERESTEYYTEKSGISFASSDNVYLVINNVYQKNLKTGNNEYIVQNGSLTNQRTDLGTKAFLYDANNNVIGLQLTNGGIALKWIDLSNENSYLEVGHPLDAQLTSEHMDVTSWFYDITMKLVGVNGTAYDRHVVFEQKPNVYIVEDPNSDGDSNANQGYVFLNGYKNGDTFTTSYGRNYTTYLNSDSNYTYLGGANGLTGQNKNPNMYVITISVSEKYKIGDPRSTTNSAPSFTYIGYRNNNDVTFNGTWRSLAWTGEGNHALEFYRAASSDSTVLMIAPKIRIASSYGVCQTGISRNNAIARCAAYQEDGIPAGRWRLPTMAEVQFIGTLSSLGRIPYLFGRSNDQGQAVDADSYYWTANGLIHINNGSNPPKAEPVSQGNGQESVRCVYDEWFWGDATTTRPVNKNTFTWGDRNF